jgi:radical SAM superfamily enzyme YgiQ (UPF0313 family)
MRVLMINSNRFGPRVAIPFGLCSVAASIEAAGHEVHILDLCFSRQPSNDISNTINELQPDLLGISVRNIDNAVGYNTYFVLDQVRDEVISPCKDVFSGPIVIGGPAVGISGAEMLRFFDIEFAIGGDGEVTIVEFIKRLEANLPVDGLGGLIRKKRGKIIEDNPPLLVKDLNSLPLVKPHQYIDLSPYRQLDSPLQIQTKRGCSLNCSYCTYNLVEGRHYRLRNPQLVANDIESLVEETGINHIEFVDSTFNIPLDHAKAILRSVMAKGMDLRLRTMGLNPSSMDEELADLMKQVGFEDVDLGVEAGCDAMLNSLGKNFKKSDVVWAGRLLRNRKITTTYYLLVGAPGETEHTLRETFDTISQVASRWDRVVIGVGVRAYNRAPIAKQMKRENPTCTFDNFLHPVSYVPESLSLESVKAITKVETLIHPNFFMYDERFKRPAIFDKGISLLLKLLFLKHPTWKLRVLLRTIQKFFGIFFVKRMLFNKRKREPLSDY